MRLHLLLVLIGLQISPAPSQLLPQGSGDLGSFLITVVFKARYYFFCKYGANKLCREKCPRKTEAQCTLSSKCELVVVGGVTSCTCKPINFH